MLIHFKPTQIGKFNGPFIPIVSFLSELQLFGHFVFLIDQIKFLEMVLIVKQSDKKVLFSLKVTKTPSWCEHLSILPVKTSFTLLFRFSKRNCNFYWGSRRNWLRISVVEDDITKCISSEIRLLPCASCTSRKLFASL